MREARGILHKALIKWRFIRILEILLASLGVGFLVFGIFSNMWIGLSIFILTFIGGILYVRPWKYKLDNVCSQIDGTIASMQHSTGLLLQEPGELNLLAQIQQSKVESSLKQHQREIRFKSYVWPLFGLALILGIVAWLLYSLGIFTPERGLNEIPENDIMNFQVLDSVQQNIEAPKLIEQYVNIRYPSYTQKPIERVNNMNLKVLEGSQITWHLNFDKPLKEAQLRIGEDSLLMDFDSGAFSKTITADYANFYAIKFRDTLDHSYLSDLYALETYADEPPSIEIEGLQQFSSFEFDAPQQLKFTSKVTDDFGLMDVAIVATVSKGTGESVKFREERLKFEAPLKQGTKSQNFSKSLNLRDLKMEPGDELYFYVEAIDNRQPKPNIARTETFFSVIKDTVTDQFAVEGTLGADLMPDYFRSQRQLIIDTEKLIADEPSIEKKEFNFRSNELGFDQKALRIKYGEFMGDETERGGSVANVQVEENTEDPLAEYTHDHDGSNEHNLVPEEEHEEHSEEDGEEDPLEAYVHNHENPEASTLFAQSLRSKLKQAMAEMWDAELYLRLFQPEKSLPYQYKALKLIQEIKNSARIYVHRIGFDPPPIKEDKRLTGKLDEIGNYSKDEALTKEEEFPNMERAIARLELLGIMDQKLSKQDQELLDKAGNDLAQLAIREPGKYLGTLQAIKILSQVEYVTSLQIQTALKGLYEALPKTEKLPSVKEGNYSRLNNLFIKGLDGE